MERNEMKWYTITTMPRKEKKVVESLETRKVNENLDHLFSEFFVAIVPYRTPKGKVSEKNLYPGYVFIKMDMTDEAWFKVRNTEFVTGLVGSSGQRTKPTPISEFQMRKMFKRLDEAKENFKNENPGKVKTNFKINVGDRVLITEGTMKDEVGTILEIHEDREVAIIELIVFERKTPTEIPIKHIKGATL
ncbi:MAG: transcription termination/antitermination protein NusG [Mycoplasma sp.]|nr:transcription termination/antitermination protein NusG [Mycoplasma sp.]